ncbi:MAG: hypothetical protein AAAB11_04450 [Rhizobium giardinii]
MEEKAEDQDGMEQVEHDVLAADRRARRRPASAPLASASRHGCTPAARLTRAKDCGRATVKVSWTVIIVQSVILFVWITAHLVGAIRCWDSYPFILNLARRTGHHDEPDRKPDIDRKAELLQFYGWISSGRLQALLAKRDKPVSGKAGIGVAPNADIVGIAANPGGGDQLRGNSVAPSCGNAGTQLGRAQVKEDRPPARPLPCTVDGGWRRTMTWCI